MITARTFLNLSAALTAKSRLESYEIQCALADENAHLYGGAPYAMPVRLLVADEFVEAATRILDTTDADTVSNLEKISAVPTEISPNSEARSNPWQILVLALVFFGPGFASLMQSHPVILVYARSRKFRPTLTPQDAHWLGVALIAVASVVALFYLRLFREIRRSEALS